MAVESGADEIVEISDPERAVVEALAIDGPLCTDCLAERLERDPDRTAALCASLAADGYLRTVARGRYAVREHAHAELRAAGRQT